MKTIKTIAASAFRISASALFCVFFISACSALPAPPVLPVVYDFGPGSIAPALPAAATAPAADRVPLVLADIQSPGLADGSTALHYRLAYDDAQQLRAYQRARWSQPPAQLVRQSVTQQLALQGPVLDSRTARDLARADAGANAGNGANRVLAMRVLRLEIEEFSQVFSSAGESSGVLRLRATLADSSPQGERLRDQRVFVVQSPATSQDAAGGSAAMARAAQQAAREVAAWIRQTAR